MEIKILSAEGGDIPFIVSLWNECFSLPWSETAITNEISDENSVFVVAHSGEERIGYALMKIFPDGGELCSIAVLPNARRLGAGRALISELFRAARSRGVDVIRLEVRASNSAAIRFYELTGFSRAGVRKNYYHLPREDAVLYNYYLMREK